MGPYRLVSMDVAIEFDDGNDSGMIHGINFIAVPGDRRQACFAASQRLSIRIR